VSIRGAGARTLGGVEFSFTFDEAAGVVTILVEGEPEPGDFRALAERLTADPRYRSGLAHLVDCSRLQPGSPSAEVLQEEMAPLVERDWHYPPRAVAIVAPDPDVYARAVLARAHMGGSATNREIFADAAEARRWLGTHRPA
jgi:hypothetical protein